MHLFIYKYYYIIYVFYKIKYTRVKMYININYVLGYKWSFVETKMSQNTEMQGPIKHGL